MGWTGSTSLRHRWDTSLRADFITPGVVAGESRARGWGSDSANPNDFSYTRSILWCLVFPWISYRCHKFHPLRSTVCSRFSLNLHHIYRKFDLLNTLFQRMTGFGRSSVLLKIEVHSLCCARKCKMLSKNALLYYLKCCSSIFLWCKTLRLAGNRTKPWECRPQNYFFFWRTSVSSGSNTVQ